MGVVVLAKFWFAFLPERGAVAGGLGLYSVSGQPGNYKVYLGWLASSLCSFIDTQKSPISSYQHLTQITVNMLFYLFGFFFFFKLANTLFTLENCDFFHTNMEAQIKNMLSESNLVMSLTVNGRYTLIYSFPIMYQCRFAWNSLKN